MSDPDTTATPPEDAAATDGDASAATAGVPQRRFPWGLLVASTMFSIAIGLLAAWWLVARDHDSSVTPEQMLSGTIPADVDVQGSVRVGQPAPTTSFTYFDGSTGSLADYAGSTVLLNFWGSTCAPCLREMPALERLHREAGAGVAVVGVDVSESVEAGRSMVQRTGVTYPQVRDPQGELMAAFRGTRLPHTVVIDRTGKVTAVVDGPQSEPEFRKLVAAG